MKRSSNCGAKQTNSVKRQKTTTDSRKVVATKNTLTAKKTNTTKNKNTAEKTSAATQSNAKRVAIVALFVSPWTQRSHSLCTHFDVTETVAQVCATFAEQAAIDLKSYALHFVPFQQNENAEEARLRFRDIQFDDQFITSHEKVETSDKTVLAKCASKFAFCFSLIKNHKNCAADVTLKCNFSNQKLKQSGKNDQNILKHKFCAQCTYEQVYFIVNTMLGDAKKYTIKFNDKIVKSANKIEPDVDQHNNLTIKICL